MERLLKQGQARSVKAYLEHDSKCKDLVIETVEENDSTISNMACAVRLLHVVLLKTAKSSQSTLSSLYTKAIGGTLKDSVTLREMFLFLKRAPSDVLVEILDDSLDLIALYERENSNLNFYSAVANDIRNLIINQTDAKAPLRSEFDVRNETLRTTVIAKKVELSKQKATLSKQDAAYSKILQDFVESLEEYLNDALIDPREMLFKEICIYDIKSPHRASFAPKTRYAIERALSSPHDYLACDCCKASGKEEEVCLRCCFREVDAVANRSSKAALSASQPSTAVLYQLYLESGALINVSDLYSAFHAIMDEKVDDENRIKYHQHFNCIQAGWY